MTDFLIVFVLVLAVSVCYSRLKILYDDIFWFIAFWVLIFGTYFFSGVYWGIEVKNYHLLYISMCLFFYVSFRYIGIRCLFNSKKLSYHKPKKIINTKLYDRFAITSAVVFISNFILLNGVILTKATSHGANSSIVSAIASIFIPLLLVLGLYYFTMELHYNNRLSTKGVLFLFLYFLPCTLNSGREAIFYVFIALISIVSYEFHNKFKRKSLLEIFHKIKLKNILLTLAIVLFVFTTIIFIYFITVNRFTDVEVENFINNYTITSDTILESQKWGKFQFLYFNIISYFSHQIPFLASLLEYYEGPHLFGMFELNIISRRLPDFLGLDYKVAFYSINNMTNGNFFTGCWPTMLGSLYIDFGVYLVPVFCCIFGYLVGKVRQTFNYSAYTPEMIVLISLICFSMFATIQLGIIYNIQYYGAFIWWEILFGNIKLKF